MNRLRSRWLAAGATAVLATGLVACGDDKKDSGGGGGGGGSDVANASFDLTIGDIVPLTGDLNTYGPGGDKAGKIAVEQLTAALKQDGISGVSFKNVAADDESKPTSAPQAASKLTNDGATCLVGAYASANTLALGNGIAVDNEVPLISPASTSPELTGLQDDGFVWRTAISDARQGKVLSDAIAKQLGGATGKTISIGARNDAYGEGIAKALKGEWEKAGGKVTGTVLYDPNQPSYNSEAGKIAGNGSDSAYVIVDFPETFAKVAPALVRTGKWDAKKAWYTDGLAVAGGAAELKKQNIPVAAIDGSNGTRPAADSKTAGAKTFAELYAASKASPTGEPPTFAAQNFDAHVLCGLAAIAAGSKDGTAIKDKLKAVSGPPGTKYGPGQLAQAIKDLRADKDIDYDGASGPIDFDDAGDPTAGSYDIYTYKGADLKVTDTVQIGG